MGICSLIAVDKLPGSRVAGSVGVSFSFLDDVSEFLLEFASPYVSLSALSVDLFNLC